MELHMLRGEEEPGGGEGPLGGENTLLIHLNMIVMRDIISYLLS